VIPDAVKGTTLVAYVGGQTAGYIDLGDRISERLPLVIATVLVLSFLLLLIAFRSIVVPLTAGLMNLLSVGAAYGILTFVFQEGHGAELLGLSGPSPIVSYVPLLMFAILFGLSMDYQVFLLTRVQEHYRKTKDNHEAVVDGLAVSARVITSAALIMVCVYTSFILSGDPTVKQFGLGLAAAIAVDATIVRCLIVPAVMVLLGRANWWLPGWTSRLLPRVGIEGEEFFKARDAAAATGSARPPG
jgi:RND superfamily putative drug exporter